MRAQQQRHRNCKQTENQTQPSHGGRAEFLDLELDERDALARREVGHSALVLCRPGLDQLGRERHPAQGCGAVQDRLDLSRRRRRGRHSYGLDETMLGCSSLVSGARVWSRWSVEVVGRGWADRERAEVDDLFDRGGKAAAGPCWPAQAGRAGQVESENGASWLWCRGGREVVWA